jgi:hypothetical protein
MWYVLFLAQPMNTHQVSPRTRSPALEIVLRANTATLSVASRNCCDPQPTFTQKGHYSRYAQLISQGVRVAVSYLPHSLLVPPYSLFWTSLCCSCIVVLQWLGRDSMRGRICSTLHELTSVGVQPVTSLIHICVLGPSLPHLEENRHCPPLQSFSV